ncbi:MAG TPA: aspartate aminotransferase family protein, partial [Thermoanaerobaculia bacterium]
ESLVDRLCARARQMGDLLRSQAGVRVLNDIVLNQVLVRFGEDDETTRRVITRAQQDGACWMAGTTWHGMAAMRISVSNWATTADDIVRSAEAILRAART